jgi:hypothetical protein
MARATPTRTLLAGATLAAMALAAGPGDAGPPSKVEGGPRAERLTGLPGYTLIRAGRGDDVIFARDGGRRDFVSCGPGTDVAVLDRQDNSRGCEIRRYPPTRADRAPLPPHAAAARRDSAVRYVPIGRRGSVTSPIPTRLRAAAPAPARPAPAPITTGSFGRPFPRSAVYRPAAGVPVDPASAALVATAIGAARAGNGGRGPTITGQGITERRWQAGPGDPVWSFSPGGVRAHAPACFSGSGTPDDTYGVYDEANRTVVRGWGGDSVALQINCGARTLNGRTIGVADLDGNGVPRTGVGTAWGLMSGLGPILGDDWANRHIDHRVKVALGYAQLARGFRAPAISYERKAKGTVSTPVPMGTTFCATWSTAQVDAAQAAAGLAGDALAFSDMWWQAMSCARGYGLVIGDGTNDGGFNIYAGHPSELPVSESAVMRPAVRVPALWDPRGWVALAPG